MEAARTADPSQGAIYKFAAGEQCVYQLSYEATAQADLRTLVQQQGAAAPSGSGPLTYVLKATLHAELATTVVSTEMNAARVLYQFRNPIVSVVINGLEQPLQEASLGRDLGRGVLVEMTNAGRMTSVRLDAGIQSFSRDFVLAVLGVTEFVFPSNGAGSALSWSSREEDRSGQYLARYHAGEKAGKSPAGKSTLVIIKRKSRYLKASAQESPGQLPGHVPAKRVVTPSGSLTMNFDMDRGRISSIEGKEAQDTSVADAKVSHGETSLSMSLVSSRALTSTQIAGLRDIAASLGSRGVRFALYNTPSPEEVETSIQRNALGADTEDTLIQQLRSAGAAGEGSDPAGLYLKFKALVYLHPETCDRLGKLLGAADSQTPTFEILAKALGAVGSPEAQQALVASMQTRPDDWSALSNLIPTLASAPAPTSQSEEWLRHLATTSPDRNISATATLALGTLAHSLFKGAPARSESMVRELIQLEGSSDSDDHRVATILALGNTGSVLALPLLEKTATSPVTRLRASSMDALRSIPSHKADTLLLRGLRDREDAVRLEAAYALGFRSMTSAAFAAQQGALAIEKSDKVRVALLNNLWSARSRFKAARELVQKAADSDPSEYVRKTARSLLLQSTGH